MKIPFIFSTYHSDTSFLIRASHTIFKLGCHVNATSVSRTPKK